jgi:G3E family GTPase
MVDIMVFQEASGPLYEALFLDEHDNEIGSLSGTDILRMKGIIAMKDDDQRFVVQGAHMLLEGGSQPSVEIRRKARQPPCVHREGSAQGEAQGRI